MRLDRLDDPQRFNTDQPVEKNLDALIGIVLHDDWIQLIGTIYSVE